MHKERSIYVAESDSSLQSTQFRGAGHQGGSVNVRSPPYTVLPAVNARSLIQTTNSRDEEVSCREIHILGKSQEFRSYTIYIYNL